MKVEILYVEGCPNLAPARAVVEQALAALGAQADVKAILVSEGSAEVGAGFAGSPTVLIDGRDVEPATATGVACRIYANGSGVPAREACERAIARALEEERGPCSAVL